MQISEIKNDVHFLCGSTSATYVSAALLRNINIAYQDTARLIWDSADGWQFDDSNKTTLPIAKTTLVHNQQDYTIPTDAQRIWQVEVKDSSGHWNKLKQWDPVDSTLAAQEFWSTPGMPIYYDLIGRSVSLIPSPASGSVTLASGIALYVDRDVAEFPASATTTTPGFATQFHRILSYAAALDFVKDENDRRFLIAQKTRLEQALKSFYGRRMIERKPRITSQSRRIWRRYT